MTARAGSGGSASGAPRLRRAVPADAPALARLRYRMRSEIAPPVEAEAAFVPRCGAWMAARLGAASPWRCWVAEDEGGAPVGAGWVELVEKLPNPVGEPERHGYVTNLYVAASRRGGGIGSRILDALLAECDAAGVDAVFLWPTPRSRSLYARHGFAVRDDLLERRGAP